MPEVRVTAAKLSHIPLGERQTLELDIQHVANPAGVRSIGGFRPRMSLQPQVDIATDT
jgi:hypothetical protein